MRVPHRVAAPLSLAVCATLPLAAQTVSPTSITSNPSATCAPGGIELHNVTLTLPPDTTTNTVDVFLLFDDTGSFAGQVAATVAIFGDLIDELQAALPSVDFAFGVGRFEDYGGPGTGFSGQGGATAEFATGRPFILNQAMLRTSTPGFDALIATALANEAPGFGGDFPETSLGEGLLQLATGAGFDGNGNGSRLDSGAAGAQATQVSPGTSGDVPPFSSYVGVGDGALGGVGFRSGALRLCVLATDVCAVAAFDAALGIPATIAASGSTEPVSAFACTSTIPGLSRFGFVSDSKTQAGNTIAGAVAPLGAATVPAAIAAINALGVRVIGLGDGGVATSSTGPSVNPSVLLSALARLTGAVDAVGNPLVFNIAGGVVPIKNAIVSAVQTTVTAPIDIVLTADPALGGLVFAAEPPLVPDVGPDDSVRFDVTLTGGGTFAGGSFDLSFRDAASNAVLGSIPVTLGCASAECFFLVGTQPANVPIPPNSVLLTAFSLLWTVDDLSMPSFLVPDDPAFVGVHIYTQVAMIAPGIDPLDPIKASNGLDIELGAKATSYGPADGIHHWLKSGPGLGQVLKPAFAFIGK